MPTGKASCVIALWEHPTPPRGKRQAERAGQEVGKLPCQVAYSSLQLGLTSGVCG